jgi:ABC-type Fe3+ transport system permease subunit
MSRPVFLALLAPGVVVAVTYWISVGWMSDTYDTERWAKVVVTAFYGLIFVGLWAFIAALGAALVRWLRKPHDFSAGFPGCKDGPFGLLAFSTLRG